MRSVIGADLFESCLRSRGGRSPGERREIFPDDSHSDPGHDQADGDVQRQQSEVLAHGSFPFDRNLEIVRRISQTRIVACGKKLPRNIFAIGSTTTAARIVAPIIIRAALPWFSLKRVIARTPFWIRPEGREP